MTAEEIEKMSISERLETIELLQESLHKVAAERLPVPDWHTDVLDERMKRIESGEAKFYSIDEVFGRLRS